MIGTWEMAQEGVEIGASALRMNQNAIFACEAAVNVVEANPEYTSVGYGGMPNEHCEVELDGAFMDGKTMSIGAVAGIKDFPYPVSIAKRLMSKSVNNVLIGEGAEKFAVAQGFERKTMLTEESKLRWKERKEETVDKGLSPYDGHDTVCMIALDAQGDMAVGTSTSGLFFKRAGRVGDTPIVGSGLYVDNAIGGAAATGLGEDIMKGCISYEIVRLMEDGHTPQDACEMAVLKLNNKLLERRGNAGDISVIAVNNKGDFGAATNIEEFPFVVMREDELVTLHMAKNVAYAVSVDNEKL